MRLSWLRLLTAKSRTSPRFRPTCEALESRIAPVVSFRQATGADLARQVFGVTGTGVAIVIMDRGIDYTAPDFVKPNGNTRIKWMLDLTGQNGTGPNNPPGVEYSETQINAALHGGPALGERDAVGHGTVTAGIAAGNGRAFAGGQYEGMAPDADLIIVKLTSEGAPAHDGQPAEAPFQGNILQALDWVDQKLDALNEPAVGLINSGSQGGPTDGTSVVSCKIDQVFGLDHPGRVYVSPSEDEGNLPDHAGGSYGKGGNTVVHFTNAGTGSVYLPLWYSGDEPAAVALTLDDGTTTGPIGPGQSYVQNGIFLAQYAPGQEPYPWTSTSGDHAVGIVISGHAGGGTLTVCGLSRGVGRFDVYGGNDVFGNTAFTDHLVPGRLSDYSATRSAIVVGAYTLQTTYTDIDGIQRTVPADTTGALWAGSSAGPTRDGREFGVDVTAPGENVFASYAPNSYFATFRSNLIAGGGGWYGRQGATSGAAPIVVGAIALMLQEDPSLTARQVKGILHESAREDRFTGETPNVSWGYGKLDVFRAIRDEIRHREGRHETGCRAYDALQILSNVTCGAGKLVTALAGVLGTLPATTEAGTALPSAPTNAPGTVVRPPAWPGDLSSADTSATGTTRLAAGDSLGRQGEQGAGGPWDLNNPETGLIDLTGGQEL